MSEKCYYSIISDYICILLTFSNISKNTHEILSDFIKELSYSMHLKYSFTFEEVINTFL